MQVVTRSCWTIQRLSSDRSYVIVKRKLGPQCNRQCLLQRYVSCTTLFYPDCSTQKRNVFISLYVCLFLCDDVEIKHIDRLHQSLRLRCFNILFVIEDKTIKNTTSITRYHNIVKIKKNMSSICVKWGIVEEVLHVIFFSVTMYTASSIVGRASLALHSRSPLSAIFLMSCFYIFLFNILLYLYMYRFTTVLNINSLND